jgi:hypothetical protein
MTEKSRGKEPWNRGPWGYVQPWDVAAQGPTIRDPKEQARWARVILLGGLPYIWRELAAPLNTIVYSLLEIKRGDKALIIGESIDPCGWAEDIRGMVGEAGEVRCFDIIERARQATIGLTTWWTIRRTQSGKASSFSGGASRIADRTLRLAGGERGRHVARREYGAGLILLPTGGK